MLASLQRSQSYCFSKDSLGTPGGILAEATFCISTEGIFLEAVGTAQSVCVNGVFIRKRLIDPILRCFPNRLMWIFHTIQKQI